MCCTIRRTESRKSPTCNIKVFSKFLKFLSVESDIITKESNLTNKTHLSFGFESTKVTKRAQYSNLRGTAQKNVSPLHNYKQIVFIYLSAYQSFESNIQYRFSTKFRLAKRGV
jgi:hypothetical protein